MPTDKPTIRADTNPLAAHRQGSISLQREHNSEDRKKRGTFRAGNAGILNGNTCAGACPRIAALRYCGYPQEADTLEQDCSKLLMFEGGIGNEDHVRKNLLAGLPFGSTILAEEEVPVKWTTKCGAIVTGRPDLVCLLPDGTAMGLELKEVSSKHTAGGILLGWPKLEHLIQAGHYFWRLRLQGVQHPNGGKHDLNSYWLLYVSRVNWHCDAKYPEWPRAKWIERQILELNKKGDPFRVRPFIVGFRLELRQGTVWFQMHDTQGNPVSPSSESIVTVDDIENFYAYCNTLVKEGLDLRDKRSVPKNLECNGEAMSYTKCQYCAFRDACKDMQLKRSEPVSVDEFAAYVLAR